MSTISLIVLWLTIITILVYIYTGYKCYIWIKEAIKEDDPMSMQVYMFILTIMAILISC